ncbi:MAG: hypothetical protein ACUVR8_13080, partial [Acidobacteriota bacterium]
MGLFRNVINERFGDFEDALAEYIDNVGNTYTAFAGAFIKVQKTMFPDLSADVDELPIPAPSPEAPKPTAPKITTPAAKPTPAP